MPRILKVALAVGLFIFLLALTLRFNGDSNPANDLIFALAVVRTPGTAVNVESTHIYLASTSGIYVPSGLMSWRKRHVASRSPLVALAADARGNIVAGNVDGQIFVSNNDGEHWDIYKVSSYPITAILLRDVGPPLIATFGDGLFTLVDGTIQSLSSNTLDPNILCLLPGRKRAISAFTSDGAFVQRHSGSWHRVAAASSAGLCSAEANGPIFVSSDGDLLVSKDGGRSSKRIVFADGGTLNVWSLASDDAGDVVVGTSRGAYLSQDRGNTFAPISLSKNPRISRLALGESAVYAQESAPPVIPGPSGPTILPPLNIPVGPLSPPAPLSAPSSSPSTPLPTYPGPTLPGEQPDPDSPPPPPPLPSQPSSQVMAIAPCAAADSKENPDCPAFVENYINDLEKAGYTAVLNNLVEKPLWSSVLAEQLGQQVLQQALQAMAQKMADRAILPIQAWAVAQNRPILMQVVQDHEAYVRGVQEAAVTESRRSLAAQPAPQSSDGGSGSSDNSSSGHTDTQRQTTLGPAFHQAGILSIHTSGPWN